MVPEWLPTTRAPPDVGDVLDAAHLDPEPLLVEGAQQGQVDVDGVVLVEAELVDDVVARQTAAQVGEGLGDLALDILGGHPGRGRGGTQHVDGELHELGRPGRDSEENSAPSSTAPTSFSARDCSPEVSACSQLPSPAAGACRVARARSVEAARREGRPRRRAARRAAGPARRSPRSDGRTHRRAARPGPRRGRLGWQGVGGLVGLGGFVGASAVAHRARRRLDRRRSSGAGSPALASRLAVSGGPSLDAPSGPCGHRPPR